jgi:hypothetical protein
MIKKCWVQRSRLLLLLLLLLLKLVTRSGTAAPHSAWLQLYEPTAQVQSALLRLTYRIRLLDKVRVPSCFKVIVCSAGGMSCQAYGVLNGWM